MSDLNSLYVGDDEDLSQAYASAQNAPVVRATPQAVPQRLETSRADAANGPQRIGDYSSEQLQQLGRQHRMSNPLYDMWRQGSPTADAAMRTSTDSLRQKGQRAAMQPLPNVPLAQLKPGRYSLDGIPNAAELMRRGAKSVLVRPDGTAFIIGLDGQNVQIKQQQAPQQPMQHAAYQPR